jgi:hypothetical protein
MNLFFICYILISIHLSLSNKNLRTSNNISKQYKITNKSLIFHVKNTEIKFNYLNSVYSMSMVDTIEDISVYL